MAATGTSASGRSMVRSRVIACAVYAGLLASLLLIQWIAFITARVPITLTVSPTGLALAADGQTLSFPLTDAASGVIFASSSPLSREFQIDGTDSINNFTEDASYLIGIADSPYYRFQARMRDNSSYSSWRDVTIRDASTGRTLATADVAPASQTFALPPGHDIVLSASWQRPEAPTQIVLVCGQNPCARVSFDRNDRYIQAEALSADGVVPVRRQLYFPLRPAPFLAELVYLLAHVALWSLVVFGLLTVLHVALLLIGEHIPTRFAVFPVAARVPSATPAASGDWCPFPSLPRALRRYDRWDLLTLLIVCVSLLFTCYVALAQYHALPHILDASAYFFQAKIFAMGHLAAPAPGDVGAFQGPFMIVRNGRWFAQYAPGTSVLLALGLLAHVPWLVEPLLGALALWGTYRIGCRLFSRPVACLAVLLGALSAFYTYLAASYLSHTVALFFTVYLVLCLLRFADSQRVRDLCLAAVCWGGLLLTRELSAVIVGVGATVFIALVHRRRLLRDKVQLTVAALSALGVALICASLYLLYNRLQAGDALISPRTLFSPADRYGFGMEIGFYGQHTLAAGLVILDQLLTILQIDLFGWPFYLTLAFIPLAFLNRAVRHTWDWFCFLLFGALVLAQAGYFYHGIYLGPRYLYETLPFLLLLTARGIANLTGWLTALSQRVPGRFHAAQSLSIARVLVGGLTVALIACNLVYYLPRQLALHTNFTGLPASEPVDVTALYDFHPASAIITTGDWYIYNYILWPLNDPALAAPTLYAYTPFPTDISRLQAEYPNRSIYIVTVAADGQVSFVAAHR